jgi:NAD-dependent deacetylase
MINEGYSPTLEQAITLISSSNQISVLTGAGISTSSGIPDFRTSGTGLWEKADPMDAISLKNFYKNPDILYTWLHPFAKQLIQAEPNMAHTVLAKMEKNKIISSVITQNIDDLHHQAGNQNIIELHGNIKKWQCLNGHTIPEDNAIFESFCKTADKPLCPICNRILKPAIVFFEESLPLSDWEKAYDEARTCDLMIVIGSSLIVSPANELPYTAIQNGAKLMIINLSNTPLDPYANIVIHEDAVKVMSEMEKGLELLQ